METPEQLEAPGAEAASGHPPAFSQLSARLVFVGTSTLGGAGAACVSPCVRAVSGFPVAGPAVPVRCAPGDNLAIHVGVAECAPGSVLVVDASEEPTFGYWGEILTVAAQAVGVAGLVIEGSVRDVEALRTLEFPVFSTGIAAAGTRKAGGGQVGEPVEVGGVRVSAGDWVVGDADGVVVVPGLALHEVLRRAEDKSEWERSIMQQIRAGATTIELFDLDVIQVQRPRTIRK